MNRICQGSYFVIQCGFDLPSLDAGEPFQKLVYGGAVTEIFEQGGHGHARAAKHSSPAEFVRAPFDSCTPLPIRHPVTSLSKRSTCSRSSRLMFV